METLPAMSMLIWSRSSSSQEVAISPAVTRPRKRQSSFKMLYNICCAANEKVMEQERKKQLLRESKVTLERESMFMLGFRVSQWE